MPNTGDLLNVLVAVTNVADARLRFEILGLDLFDTTSSVKILTSSTLRLGVLSEAWIRTGADAFDFND